MKDAEAEQGIAELVEGFERMTDDDARARARELVAGVLAFHRRGLVRALEIVRGDPHGAALVAALAEDTAVGSLLVLHDLHPQDLEARARDAVARLALAYPDLAWERLDAGRLRVRIGARGGNPASAAAAVEAALLEAVPDLSGVHVAVSASETLVTLRRKGSDGDAPRGEDGAR
jgi:hypothetical protein